MISNVDKDSFNINKFHCHIQLFMHHAISDVVLSMFKEIRSLAYITLEPKLGHYNNIVQV